MEKEITALKAQKRNPNRISIYLDGEYAFGLSRIVSAWLRIGQILGDDEIERLKEQDTLEVACQKGLRFLGYRPRSEMELQRKLNEQGFAPPVIDAVIRRFRENGILSDEQFARNWVENRLALKPRSKRMLTMELRQKGIAEEEIQKVLTATEDETSLAYQAAVVYAHRLVNVDRETFRKRLGGFLMRRGFSYGTVNPILRQVWEEIHASEDSENLDFTEDDGL